MKNRLVKHGKQKENFDDYESYSEIEYEEGEELDMVEDNEEDDEEDIEDDLPWQRLPTLREERDEQAKERMMKQAELELRLKTPINNKEGLSRKIEEIGWLDDNNSLINQEIPHLTSQLLDDDDGQRWLVHQCNVSSFPTQSKVENFEDDLQREIAFYNQAKESVAFAWPILKSNNVKYLRPEDYFAEMIKSDYHMTNIRGKLVREKRELEAREGRKKQRMMKKMAKQTQQQRTVEKQEQKKKTLDLIDKWKKKSKFDRERISIDSILENNTQAERLLDGNNRKDDKKRKRDSSGGPRKTKGAKREQKDKKYGFGGRRSKENDKNSTNDFMKDFNNTQRSFSGGKGKGGSFNKGKGGSFSKGKGGSFGGKGGKGKGGGKNNKRPGKNSRRTQQK